METRIYPDYSISVDVSDEEDLEEKDYITVKDDGDTVSLALHGSSDAEIYYNTAIELTVDEAEALVSMLQQSINIIKRVND